MARSRRPGTRSFLFLPLLFATLLLGAQELPTFFSRSPEAEVYAGIRPALENLALLQRSALSTDQPLVGRLIEAAHKAVPPDRLLASLEDETGKLLRVASLLSVEELEPRDRTAAAAYYSQVGLLLRSGMGLEDFEAALRGSLARGDGRREAPERALATLSVFAGMELDSGPRLLLLEALAAGSVATDRLKDLRASWASLEAAGIRSEEIVAILVESYGPNIRSRTVMAGGAGNGHGQVRSVRVGRASPPSAPALGAPETSLGGSSDKAPGNSADKSQGNPPDKTQGSSADKTKQDGGASPGTPGQSGSAGKKK